MKQFCSFYLAAGLLILTLPGYGQEEKEFKQLLQEFNFTQAVYPQEKKELQFTLTGFLLRSELAHDLDLGFDIEYGLTDRLQVEAEIINEVINPRDFDETGKSSYNFKTGLLYNFINRPGFSSSLVLELGLPVHKVSPDSVSFEYDPHIILAKQIGKSQLHVDTGVEIHDKEKEYFYNLALVYPIGAFKPLLEFNGSYAESSDFFLSPGLVWNGRKNLEVVTGTTLGLWQKGRPWGVSIKLIYEFSLAKSSAD
jgi:hypothetical protein